eukprot:2991449-Alexandrium_andersonii.AAC.1
MDLGEPAELVCLQDSLVAAVRAQQQQDLFRGLGPTPVWCKVAKANPAGLRQHLPVRRVPAHPLPSSKAW